MLCGPAHCNWHNEAKQKPSDGSIRQMMLQLPRRQASTGAKRSRRRGGHPSSSIAAAEAESLVVAACLLPVSSTHGGDGPCGLVPLRSWQLGVRGGRPPPSSTRSAAVLLPGRSAAARLPRCGGKTGPASSRGGDPPPSGVAASLVWRSRELGAGANGVPERVNLGSSGVKTEVRRTGFGCQSASKRDVAVG